MTVSQVTERTTAQALDGHGEALPSARRAAAFSIQRLRHPTIVVCVALTAVETLPVAFYGRALAAVDPLPAILSMLLSASGTVAMYLLLVQLARLNPMLRVMSTLAITIWTILLQLVFFGIYREFSTLPTVSVIDFARQTPEYAWALFRARLGIVPVGITVVVIALAMRGVRRAYRAPFDLGVLQISGLVVLVLGAQLAARAPFMTVSQQALRLLLESSRGPGVINTAWKPDRVRPSNAPAAHPVNFLVFRLEEIAADATTLARPELQTTPYLSSLVAEHPREAFVARQHFANSTATDVSVLTIYTGLSPAADLEAHRHVPTLWDYFTYAGYDTSLFVPFHLEWGDFKTRFRANPETINISKLVDARSSGAPIVYDNSINDADVARLASRYQEQRGWAEPFLQIVSLKMPHAIGEGARVNKLSYDPWKDTPAGLHDYYNGIRHDDGLMREYLAEIPAAVRERTVVVVLSDHGTRLFARTDGIEELHRLDNYHEETTRVPFVIYVPAEAQRMIPERKLEHLRENLSSLATSNIDMLPTMLGLAGIQPVDWNLEQSDLVAGRNLTEATAPTKAIVQLNTGPLRRWDREHFGLVLDNGHYQYLFSMGRELLFDLQADPREQSNLISDQAFGSIGAGGRALATQLPELLRIQQKYKQQGLPEPPVPQKPEVEVLSVSATRGSTARVRREESVGGGKVVRYLIDPPNPRFPLRAEFVAEVRAGTGDLEWRVRGGAGVQHVAHVEKVSPGESDRFAFYWQPASNDDTPLSVEVLAKAGGAEALDLALENASVRVERTVRGDAFEVDSLTREPPNVERRVYGFDRFQVHPCLRAGTSVTECPNGFLAWGPYVKGSKGGVVHLHYDIDVAKPGAKIWFDVTSEGGRAQLARSSVYQLAEAGSHSFELQVPLANDADRIEGRMLAHGGESLKGYGIRIRGAQLSVTGAAPH